MGHWEDESTFKHSTSPEMSEFGNDSSSHLPWREQHMDRDPATSVPAEHDPHPGGGVVGSIGVVGGVVVGARSSQSHLYDHYNTTPPAVSETEDWSSSANHHDAHGMVGSPHSQGSTGSMMDSPQSQQSDNRRSVDMSAAGQPSHAGDPQHMSLSERRQEKRKMKRFR